MILLANDDSSCRISRSAKPSHVEVGLAYNCMQLSLQVKASNIPRAGNGIFTMIDYVGIGNEGDARRDVGWLFGKIMTHAERNALVDGTKEPADQYDIDYITSRSSGVENSLTLSDILSTSTSQSLIVTSLQCPMRCVNSCKGMSDEEIEQRGGVKVRFDLPKQAVEGNMDYHLLAVTIDASISVRAGAELMMDYDMNDLTAANEGDGDGGTHDEDEPARMKRNKRRRMNDNRARNIGEANEPQAKAQQRHTTSTASGHEHYENDGENMNIALASSVNLDFAFRPLSSLPVRQCMDTHGYACVTPDLLGTASLDFIASVDVDAIRQVDASAASKISGSVDQYELKNSPVMMALMAKWRALVGLVCALVGIEFTDAHHLVAPIMLTSMDGAGQQDTHWDSRWGIEQKKRHDNDKRGKRYSIILSFKCGRSTSFPIWPLGFISTTESDHRDPIMANAAKRTMRDMAFLLLPPFFHSVPVEAGTVTIFDHRVPHHGMKNTTGEERIVLFDIISTQSFQQDPKQASYQYNPYQYISEAYGIGSPKHICALMECAKTNPLMRFSVRDRALIVKGVNEGVDLMHRVCDMIINEDEDEDEMEDEEQEKDTDEAEAQEAKEEEKQTTQNSAKRTRSRTKD